MALQGRNADWVEQQCPLKTVLLIASHLSLFKSFYFFFILIFFTLLFVLTVGIALSPKHQTEKLPGSYTHMYTQVVTCDTSWVLRDCQSQCASKRKPEVWRRCRGVQGPVRSQSHRRWTLIWSHTLGLWLKASFVIDVWIFNHAINMTLDGNFGLSVSAGWFATEPCTDIGGPQRNLCLR